MDERLIPLCEIAVAAVVTCELHKLMASKIMQTRAEIVYKELTGKK